MDAVSYAHSAKQAKRIKRFIENLDSNSGVLTQPKVIEAGETVTIKSGRMAILADTVIDGDLVIEAGGDVFIPAGAGFGDLSQRIATLDDTAVKLTGNQTIEDVKTFTSNIIGNVTGNVTGNAGTATELQTAITINGVAFNGSASITVSDSTAVKLTGNQTIEDVKTFSSSPIVPTPTANTQVANKAYVDSKAAASSIPPVGAIGSYAYLGYRKNGASSSDTITVTPGDSYATGSGLGGSTLVYAGVPLGASSTTASGTWRAMGYSQVMGQTYASTLFLRIA